ncbi:triose-phosphate transporter [Myriangium duriaei CBS 260.36]|uniref:Triose-phosphate transporter n=1 Tax=Myriangium duriaei CBS 260.36 TaxID=1168546 RepID=A0A9P4J822_9PEZI|nr:triose-phosphate transporter [Myriangium duriaei CBS 260.36]
MHTRTSDDIEDHELESALLHESEKEAEQNSHSVAAKETESLDQNKLLRWIAVNIVATIAIVFINKAIFEDPALKKCQLLFASFHFFVTFGTLHLCSTQRFRVFERKEATIKEVMPIAVAMCANVILPNLSLAYSSVTFYQTVRVLLTPLTALFNFTLYSISISQRASLTLIPVCFGVAFLTWSDVQPADNVKSTSFIGVFFAMTGVVASSIYTIWIQHFRTKLSMTSVQLLHQQSLVGAVLLLYFVPWIDQLPVWSSISGRNWLLILMSGLCACLINLSQFVIVAGAGAVASTVVGHTKTITIVAIGWTISGRSVADGSIFGVVTAIGGIILYSIVSMKDKAEGR